MDALRKLLPFIRPYRFRLAIALLGVIALTGLMVLPPLVLRYIIDDVATPGAKGGPEAEVWTWLLPAAAVYASLPIFTHILRFFSMRLLIGASQRFLGDLRLAMYDRILHHSMKYHGTSSSGVLISRLMDDIEMLQALLQNESVTLIVNAILFVASLTMIYYINWMLGSVLLVIIVLYVLVYRHYSSRIRSATQSYRTTFDRIAERLQETVSGVRQVRIYNREDWENELFLGRTSASLDKNLESRMSSVGLTIACSAIAGYGSTLIFALSGYFVLKTLAGDSSVPMQLGDLMAVDRYVWLAITPAISLATIAAQMSETFVSVRRVQEVLDAPLDIDTPDNAPVMKRGAGGVCFKDVNFAYDPESPLYEGLNLTVEPGMTVALVGHTGCGKTTLTGLLMRQWDVDSGAVLIDGTDIRTVRLRSLREIFGVVLQDPVVFEGTVAENIAYGRPDAPRQEIIEAAKTAEIHDSIERLAEGYDTTVGKEGVKFSVGEKQRLSIARAILKDPVILVMDEATSSLDSHSEALIQKALGRVLEGRTSFVVAHRLSTITGADMIVVMDDGAIVEQGTHDELMAIPGGTYQRLYEELRGGNIEDGEANA